MFIYMYCCVCLCTYMYVGVHVCIGLLGRVFSIHLYLLVCWLHATVFRVRLVRSGPVAEDPERFGFVPLWTRHTGDSKTDSWDES